jgi:glycosyltransferase involved in cell wall biosynthesis
LKKVLIISYYWPPSGGAGVQRWLKFSKYLPHYNIKPIVFTPSNPEYPVEDHALNNEISKEVEVIKIPIWEPYHFYKKFTGRKKHEKLNAGFTSDKKKFGLLENISVWIRGNLFIPDARCFWIKPATNYLMDYLKMNKVNAIISTGPPHSMHIIALNLKKNMPELHWIADFRDPWTNIDYYKDLKLSDKADRKHHELELAVLENANQVISVGNTLNKELKQILKKDENKFSVILNGYDEDDFNQVKVLKDNFFSIAHIGTMARSRNPVLLWDVLSEICKENKLFSEKLKIKIIGKTDHSVIESIQKCKLDSYLIKTDYLPHNEVVHEQMKSSVLLLMVNNTPNAKGILTGKFFEYLAAGNPILCIGPTDGDLAEIINDTNCGMISDFNDRVNLKKNVLILFNEFINQTHEHKSNSIENYKRKNLTALLAKLIP